MPAHIQMEGYDIPQYANTQYPWDGREEIHPGQIPERFNPVASYVKYFTIPEGWQGRRVFISFQGAESGLALWLNGSYIGYSEDSFTPAEFELTAFLKEGENKLQPRSLNGPPEAGVRIRTFSGFPEFTGMYICIPFRRFTQRISVSVHSG